MARLTPGQLLQKAVAYHQGGNLNAAASRYQDVLKDNPNNYDAQRLLGVVAYQRKNYELAERLLRRAIALNSNVPDAHYFLGRCLADAGRLDEATQCYRDCLTLDARHLNAALSLAALLESQADGEAAVAALSHVLAINTRAPDVLLRRGNLLAKAGLLDEAVSDFDTAIASDARFAPAMISRASAFMTMGRYADAIPDLQKCAALDPSLSDGGASILHCRMQIADWRDIAEAEQAVIAKLREGSITTNPAVTMSLATTAQDQRKAAERFVAVAVPPRASLWTGERFGHDRIRVGYLSGDLRDHAVGFLLAGVLEQHDRRAFEVIAFATSPPRDTPFASRLHAAFDDFVDVSRLGDEDTARLIRSRDIDILVDLGGLTTSSRPGVVAFRPAPVQVNWLGYASTMGTPAVDYLIGDRIVTPQADDAFFLEKVVRLPDSYLPTDDKRAIGETPTRTEVGLPDSGFVFCSFNNIYKITPAIFDIWMRLLSQVDGSVLWLQQGYPEAADNLRREAETRGVDSSRLVFAPRAPDIEDHLARQRLADLFLDTLPYNAHATTADALWAGLPVLTCAGDTFAGRVAASLLQAAGLGDMIAHSLVDYETKALTLARDPAALAAVKARLNDARDRAALFDTARFARHLERAFTTMVEPSRAGAAPMSFDVPRIG